MTGLWSLHPKSARLLFIQDWQAMVRTVATFATIFCKPGWR